MPTFADRSMHGVPALTLPVAGNFYLDPTFGTKIHRITDATMGTHNYHGYSYWPVFNANATRMLLSLDDVPWLFTFDPVTGASAQDRLLRPTGAVRVAWQGAIWDPTQPNILYALDDQWVSGSSGARLWKIDVSINSPAGYTVLKDFTSILPTASSQAYQLQMNADATVFAFFFREHLGDKFTSTLAVCWNRTTNTTYTTAVTMAGKTLNEVQLGKTGLLATLAMNEGGAQLWACQSGASPHPTADSYTLASPDFWNGHEAIGTSVICLSSGLHSGIDVRTFAAPRTPINILTFFRGTAPAAENYDIGTHSSFLAADETKLLVSTYTYVPGYIDGEPFQNEIMLVNVDGSGFQRLAHTRSDPQLEYWAQPRVSISRDGKWIVWTSNMLTAGARHDVFVLQMPSAPPVQGVKMSLETRKLTHVVRDDEENWLATFTLGCRTVRVRGPQRTFTESGLSDTVTHDNWVRLLAAPFTGKVDTDWLHAALEQPQTAVPDVLAVAMEYIVGGPKNAAYGPNDGADFYDYAGTDWTSPDAGVKVHDPAQLGQLDCSGYMREVFGVRLGMAMSWNPLEGYLPRRSKDIFTAAPGRVLRVGLWSQGLLYRLRPGDLVFFNVTVEADPDEVDHVGIFLGRGLSGDYRFLSSRSSPGGPTFGDVGGRSCLNKSAAGTAGTYSTTFTGVRRL